MGENRGKAAPQATKARPNKEQTLKKVLKSPTAPQHPRAFVDPGHLFYPPIMVPTEAKSRDFGFNYSLQVLEGSTAQEEVEAYTPTALCGSWSDSTEQSSLTTCRDSWALSLTKEKDGLGRYWQTRYTVSHFSLL